jgi:SPP1 gp7 family putative phage head morphogenesis protein
MNSSLIVAQYERELIAQYKTALDAIRSDLVKIAGKYKLTGSVSDSDRFRFARDRGLYNAINDRLTAMHQKVVSLENSLIKTGFKQGYYRYMFDIDKQTGFQFSMDNSAFSKLPSDAIEAITSNSKFLVEQNGRYFEALSNMESKTKRAIQTSVTQGIIQGKSIPDIAMMVKKDLGEATNNAVRIARTETQRAMNKGALEAVSYAEANGVKMTKQWVATKDDRTRDTHQEMDGQIADVDGGDGEMYFTLPGGALTSAPGQSGIAEEDINCRCTFITLIDEYKPTNMSARNPETGNSEVVEYQNYKDWYQDKVGSEEYNAFSLDNTGGNDYNSNMGNYTAQEKWAEINIAQKVDYSFFGKNAEIEIQTMHDSVYTFNEKYGLDKLNFIGPHSNPIQAAYNPFLDQLKIGSKNIQEIHRLEKEYISQYGRDVTLLRHSIFSYENKMKGIVNHELGHKAYVKHEDKFIKMFENTKDWKEEFGITIRAVHDYSECVAENIAVFEHGDIGYLNERMLELLTSILKGR